MEDNNTAQNLEGMQYKCQNCGSEMLYNPETNSLFCETCKSTRVIEVKDFEIIENNLDEAFNRLKEKKVEINEDSNLTEVACKSCGGKSIFSGSVFASKCVYCGSSLVATVKNSTYIQPEYIVPFSVTKEEADMKIKNWTKDKYFMNSGFKKTLNNDGLYGVYVSYWTFDVDVETKYNFLNPQNRHNQIGLDPIQSKVPNPSGNLRTFYDDILVPGVSRQIPEIYNQTHNFDTKKLVPYDEQYITGFIAMKYELDLKTAWLVAKQECKANIERDIRRKIHSESVINLNITPILEDIKFKQIVLPIWISGYTHNGRTYKCIVNGQNGAVSGEYPKNKSKLILLGTIAIIFWLMVVIMIFSSI